ncbi:hypothetical protein ScalyP_jg9946 [Parmales sp. scaly parma]|nr:hypothetical protein ScalyP_jg9946 [Parmales sp. scaly parma]
MSQLRHPNIITIMGALWDEKMVGIVLEFASGGALDDALGNSNISKDWTWKDPFLRINGKSRLAARQVMSKTAVEEIRPDLTSFPISSIRNLIQLCWASRPKTRPTFTEILHVLETHCKEEVQIKDEMKVEVERKTWKVS